MFEKLQEKLIKLAKVNCDGEIPVEYLNNEEQMILLNDAQKEIRISENITKYQREQPRTFLNRRRIGATLRVRMAETGSNFGMPFRRWRPKEREFTNKERLKLAIYRYGKTSLQTA